MADASTITQRLLRCAVTVAEEVTASAVMVYADVFEGHEELSDFARCDCDAPVVFVTRTVDEFLRADEGDWQYVRVPDVRLTRLGQIKVGLLLGLAEGIFSHGDVVVCLSGMADSGMLDTIVVMEVGEELEMFAAADTESIREQVMPTVFTRVLDLAIALGNEGREGKPVGTIFVLGDCENVMPHIRQMVLNPFKGYEPEERNVLNPDLTETIKEFAALDGAFIIRGDGTVEAAGAFFSSGLKGAALPLGLGARHNSAAGISSATKAVALVVSESTGNVTVMREGSIVMGIERPRPIGTRRREDVPREEESPYSTREEADSR